MAIATPIARRIGLLDHPGGRKDHARPTPVIGGLGVAGGALIAASVVFDPSPQLTALAIAAVLVVAVGVWDDAKDLPWQLRILTHVTAALVLVYVGNVRVEQIGPVFGLGISSLGSFSIPFTVLATVGLINALNMADGIDGLTGSLVLCALGMLTCASLYAGNASLAALLIIVAAAVAAFLLLNMRFPWQPRGRVFLGDSGSGFLGLVIAWAAFSLTQNAAHPVSPVLAPFLIAPPVIDCLVLMARRISHGHSPFEADRSHLHHLMLDAGFSVTAIVIRLSLFSLALGLMAAVALLVNIPHPILLGVYAAMTIGYFLMTANRTRAVGVFRRLGGKAVQPPPREAEAAEAAE